jgi:hypothetical protein
MHRVRDRRWLGCLAAWALFLAGGCANFDSTTDPAFGLSDVVVATPSFSADIQPIFTRRCSIGGCHSLATAQAGLTLVPGASYESLVGVPSRLRPEFVRVAPFDPANSWLVRMIGPDPSGRFGRQRMPLSSMPLTANQIATIVNWIEQGAPRN